MRASTLLQAMFFDDLLYHGVILPYLAVEETVLQPNASGEPRPIAEATQERKLLGVGSTAMFGAGVWRDIRFTHTLWRWCFPGCCHLFVDGSGQEPLIPNLLEVVIVGKRLPHPTVPHHDKRRAICETEGFVDVPLEHLPGFFFPVRRNMDNRD